MQYDTNQTRTTMIIKRIPKKERHSLLATCRPHGGQISLGDDASKDEDFRRLGLQYNQH